MAWDTLDYHLYAGFSALNDRFAQDYFAAGPQSYFNPYVYVPFYLLVRWGLPALAISSVLAVLQSAILWLTFEIGVACSGSVRRSTRVSVGVMAAALALVNPILLQELGSSFADITTAEVVMGGWLLLALAVRTPRVTSVALAGALLGAATALKGTNAVHLVSATAVLLFLPTDVKGRIKYYAIYVCSAGLGFLLLAGTWAYHLLRMFGNPFFPLMNGWFRSPEFITGRLLSYRFIPASIAEALWRPFALGRMGLMVDSELSSPDLRYAALIVLGVMLCLRWLWRRLRREPGYRKTEEAGEARLQAALGCGFALDWGLWLAASGNGRYFLPMACLAAVLIVVLLFRLFASHRRGLIYIFLGLMGAQILQLDQATELRWNKVPWGGSWLEVQVPEELASKPSLYLTVGVQSNAFIAAYLPRGSGLINFSGEYPLGPDDVSGARIQALIRRNMPNVRVLVDGERLYSPEQKREPTADDLNTALERFGLQVVEDDCAAITLKGLPTPVRITYAGAVPVQLPAPNTSYLLSCRVVRGGSELGELAAQRHLADRAFDNLELSCPRLFQPRGLYTEHAGYDWQRLYMNTDLTAWISHGSLRFQSAIPGAEMIALGSATDWAKAPLPMACGERDGRYFARVLGPDAAVTRGLKRTGR